MSLFQIQESQLAEREKTFSFFLIVRNAICLLFFFIKSPLSKVCFALSWRHPLQTKIVMLWGRERRRHRFFMIAWVFFLPGSHYDDSSFIVCFIWYSFMWGVSPNFYRIYLLHELCLILQGPVEHFWSRGCGPVGSLRKLHELKSFLQISVPFRKRRKLNLANWGTYGSDFLYPVWTYAYLMSQQTTGKY